MKKVELNNRTLKNEITEMLKGNYEFTKGGVSGNSIEVKEGNSFSSYCYYDDEVKRDEDLKTIEELLK